MTFLEIPNLQSKRIRDIQFRSSIKFGFSFAIALVLLPVFLILSFIIFPSWWIPVLIFVSLPLSGLFAWNYYLELRRIIGGFRIRNYIKNHNEGYLTLKKNHDELVNLVAGIY
jgi:hypothetical protein